MTDTFTGEVTDEVAGEDKGEVTGEVDKLLAILTSPKSRSEMQELLELKSQANFRVRYLQPALALELIEMTIPEKPNSRRQQYRLTTKGQVLSAKRRLKISK